MGRLFIIRFFEKQSVNAVKGGDYARKRSFCK